MPLKNSSKSGKRSLLWQQVLIVTITLTVVAVVILLGRQIYRETRERATEQFNQQQLILARAAAAGIEAYYKELSNAMSSLANLPNIQHMASESLTCIQHTYWGFPPRTSIRLLDNDGILRFIYPLDGWRGELIGRNYGEEAYFQETRETGRISVSGLIVNEQGETRIRIAVPVYLTYKTETVRLGDESGIIATPIYPDEPEAGRFQGVLVGSLDPHIIAQGFVSPIVSGKTGYAWLLNGEGIFIAHHEEGFTGRNGFEVRAERNPDISYEAIEQIQHRMMAGEEGVGRYISGWHRGQKGETEKLVAYTPVHINGNTWSVAVCAPVSEAEEVIQMTKRTEQYTLAFVILALMAGGLALFTTSYRWSRSLEQEVGRRTRELRETSDYLSNLIRYANAPIIVWNPDRQVTIFNEAFEKMSGRTEAEMMDQPLDVLFPEESLSDALYKIEGASKGEYWGTVEIPILRQDGEIRLGLWNSANIYGEDGKTLIATVAQGQDITARKRAEEALRESEIRYCTTIDAMGDAIHLVGPDLRFTLVNSAHRQWAKELGSGTPDYIGQTIFEVFPSPPDGLRDKLRDEYDRVFRTGETLITEESTTIGGKELVTETRKIPIFEKERVIHVVTVMRDITKRKRAEEALRESEAQKQALLDASPDMIMQIDTNMKILWANRTALDMNLDAVGQTCHKAFPGMNEPCEGCPCKKAINTGQIEMGVQYQPAVVGVQGESYWEDIGVPLMDSDGKVVGVIEIARNVTERVLAEEALHRSLERTSRGQRLLLALSQAAQAVQRARTPDEVYQTVGGEVARLDYQVAIFTLTDDRAHLTVRHLTVGPAVLRAARRLTGLPAQDYRFPLVPGGFFARIIAAGETTFVERITEIVAEALPGPVRPLASRLAALLGMERSILSPLTVGGERHGLLAVVGADLTEADVPAITAFATQAATAIENAWLFEKVRAGREQLRDLTSYLQTAREEERAYIAREIHDDFGQSLTALKMDLAWLTKRLADRPRLTEKASTMSDLIDSTIQTVRRVATQLRPGLLDDLGLAAAIEWQAQELAERTGINCELYLGDEDIVLDRDLATAIFRIFQETLTNVARHAEATEVQVELEDGTDELVLIVRDNGKGITPGQISDPHSLGLIGMRERARSWDGDVTFQSIPGQGTTVTVRMPRPN